ALCRPNCLCAGAAPLAVGLARSARLALVGSPLAQAAQRLPPDAWQCMVRCDCHGKELVGNIAELERGLSYGPDTGVRLTAVPKIPAQLTPESTWYLATSLPHRADGR